MSENAEVSYADEVYEMSDSRISHFVGAGELHFFNSVSSHYSR